ncbi:MAG: hypothetical protein U5P10_00005, partial [Spirochaetia bacterium]|nr:hypothetical protein [Spirochaetia bacterium]
RRDRRLVGSVIHKTLIRLKVVYMSKKIYRYCITCGKKIVTDPGHDKKYCSQKCFFINKQSKENQSAVR